MANWVEQHLHVVGSKVEVDSFISAGYRPRNKNQFDSLLDLHALCPLKRREPKTTYTHDTAVVLIHYRTRTQAFFGMMTSWDYPAVFYARLATHWPSLSFACTINDETGSFGGVVMVVNGDVVDLVRDYSEDGYSRRTHARHVRAALTRWDQEVLSRERDWRLMALEPWERKSMRVDAHFDDDAWFYFRSREAMAQFRARYGGRVPLRRVNGEWKGIRLARA